MILEEKDGDLTIRYDFNDERLSLIIHNPEDNSETQINIRGRGISKIADVLEHIGEKIYKDHEKP